tara:strand:+ start:1517 stop:1888 length:372 start_codon:yes stop_codon:yes gene_type:complete
MYSKKVRKYYRNFYGKTFANMSYVSEGVKFDNMKGITSPWKYNKRLQLFYVYKLEWGNGNSYYGCTGQKPHKRLQNHIWEKGLDSDKTKMTIIKSFFDKESAEMEEQWYIDRYYNNPKNHNKT